MDQSRRRFLATTGASAAVAGVTALTGFPALAQSVLDKPLHIISGYPAGGATDLLQRIVSTRLSKLWNGRPVVFDYRPGAAAAIGAEALARAPADGTVISLIDSGPMCCLPNLRKLPYNPQTDFTLLSYCGGGPIAVLANPSLPASDIPGLVKLAKARPGQLTFAHSGLGTTQHLAGELFNLRAGVDIRNVPYKGGAPAMTDLVGNQVDLCFGTVGPAVQLVSTGKLKVLGVTSTYRSSAFPDVPTIAQQGYPDYDGILWYGFAGPARIPAAVSQQLQEALRTALADPEVVAALQKAGLDDIGARTPEWVAELIARDVKKWGEVVQRGHITMDS